MIIDLILDRKDGVEYDPHKFFGMICEYEDNFGWTDHKISNAMESGNEQDVKRELCSYVINNGYNPEICNYINSVSWLTKPNSKYHANFTYRDGTVGMKKDISSSDPELLVNRIKTIAESCVGLVNEPAQWYVCDDNCDTYDEGLMI